MSKIHIISRGNNKWALKREGSSRAIKLFVTRESAIRNSKDWLYNTDTLVIHNKDGTVAKIIKNAGRLTEDRLIKTAGYL